MFYSEFYLIFHDFYKTQIFQIFFKKIVNVILIQFSNFNKKNIPNFLYENKENSGLRNFNNKGNIRNFLGKVLEHRKKDTRE